MQRPRQAVGRAGNTPKTPLLCVSGLLHVGRFEGERLAMCDCGNDPCLGLSVTSSRPRCDQLRLKERARHAVHAPRTHGSKTTPRRRACAVGRRCINTLLLRGMRRRHQDAIPGGRAKLAGRPCAPCSQSLGRSRLTRARQVPVRQRGQTSMPPTPPASFSSTRLHDAIHMRCVQIVHGEDKVRGGEIACTAQTSAATPRGLQRERHCLHHPVAQ